MNKDDILSLPRLVSNIRREWKIVTVSILVFLCLALLYVFLAPAKYTAKTSILLDPAQSRAVADISDKAIREYEATEIVSQIELIKSRGVAIKAYEYMQTDGLEKVNAPDEAILSDIRKGLNVYREGLSHVLSITYTAKDPQVAAIRANAFAEAYRYDQINSFSQDSVKTTKWLQGQIDTLRQQSIEANEKIQKFRTDNNLVESANGVSVNDIQFSNLTSSLSAAKADATTARVRYQHSVDIVRNKNITAAVAEAFDNDVINNVRAQYLEDQKKLLELTRTLGSQHQAVGRLKKRISESRNVIFAEMKRLSQSYKSEYEIALARQKSLDADLRDLMDTQLSNGGHEFELDALEKEAKSYADLHDESLKKFETMQQQKTFPTSAVRVITKAVKPMSKSHPKSAIILGLALIFGTGLGILLALLKDSFDSSFKRAGQVENTTGMHFLGFFPTFSSKAITTPKASDLLDGEYSQSVDVPMSLQAETCRNVKSTLQRKCDKPCKVIGVVSDNPNPAKSVSASNLALHLANTKSKCLLIDGDLRHPTLTLNNLGRVENGLGSVLSQSSDLQSAVVKDPKTGLHMLAAEDGRQYQDMGLVSTDNMKSLITQVKDQFDYIVIDLPPLSVTSDASFSSVFIDHFLVVLEWGKSKPNNLEFVLKINEIPKEKILGAVLGQADMKKMAKNYGHNLHADYVES